MVGGDTCTNTNRLSGGEMVSSSSSSLCESSASILDYLLEQRVVVERETSERFNVLIEHIPQTNATFDLFIAYLNREVSYHKDLSAKCAELLNPNTLIKNSAHRLLKFLEILKCYHSTAFSDLESLHRQIDSHFKLTAASDNITSNSFTDLTVFDKSTTLKAPADISSAFDTLVDVKTPTMTVKNNSTAAFASTKLSLTNTSTSTSAITTTQATPAIKIKPPSEVPPPSNNRWFRRKPKPKKKTSEPSNTSQKTSDGEAPNGENKMSDTINNDETTVDSEGYSIRPETSNDERDDFYSSSEESTPDNDGHDSNQRIKFEIKPISPNDSSARTALDEKLSTEELRTKALGLALPDVPIKRNRVPGGIDAQSRNSSVDFSVMLGLKPSLSQRSLHSDCSALSEFDSMPPPVKPPPRPIEVLKPTIANSSRKSSVDEGVCPPNSNAVSKHSNVDRDHNLPPPIAPPALPPKKPNTAVPAILRRPLPSAPVPPPRPSSVVSNGPVAPNSPPSSKTPPKLPPRKPSLTSQPNTLERSSFLSKSSVQSSFDDAFAPMSSISTAGSSTLCNSAFTNFKIISSDAIKNDDRSLPLSFSFHEKISAIIESEDITSSVVQIIGAINLIMPSSYLDKMIISRLGKICFEIPQLVAFHESVSVNCLQPLVEIREKEAVDDPVVYEIDPANLADYINTRPSMELYHIKVIEYQIKVDKQSDYVEESMHLAPLQIMSYCRTVGDAINIKIEYMYNEGAFPKDSQPELHETSIVARIVGSRKIENVVTDPNANWDSVNKQAIWQLGVLSPETLPGKGTGVLKAKINFEGEENLKNGENGEGQEAALEWSHKKMKKLLAVGARFRCEGSVTGITINLISTDDYKIASIIHNTTTGQYVSLSV